MIFKLKEKDEGQIAGRVSDLRENTRSDNPFLYELKSKKYIFDSKKRLKKGLKWINKMGKGGYIHHIYINELYVHAIRQSIYSCEIKYFKDNWESARIYAGIYGDSKKMTKLFHKSSKNGFSTEREVMFIDGKYFFLLRKLKGMNDPQIPPQITGELPLEGITTR